jgi:hypothetical protein
VPQDKLKKLKEIGKQHNLKDIRNANVMKFGKNSYKIVDATRVKT